MGEAAGSRSRPALRAGWATGLDVTAATYPAGTTLAGVPTTRRALAIAASALALAAPPVASAQTPGDEQYTDPFGGSAPSQPEPSDDDDGGGGSQPQPSDDDGGGGSQPQPSDDDAAGDGTDGATPPAATTAPPDTGGSVTSSTPATTTETLAATGFDAATLALGGAILLAGGLALRVTLSERGRRRR
jgi:hypothetical protein